jgi:hypothetical protein
LRLLRNFWMICKITMPNEMWKDLPQGRGELYHRGRRMKNLLQR